jgi:hypothetical protein
VESVPISPLRTSVPAVAKTVRIPTDLDRRIKLAKAEWEVETQNTISLNAFILMLLMSGLTSLKT